MTHPHQLHAAAAAASLRIALVALGHAAVVERYGWAAASDGLRSPTWASGSHGQGGHGDPVAESVMSTVRTAGDRRSRWTFATLAAENGVADRWRLDAAALNFEIATITPSGRVWDPKTWRWEEPVGYDIDGQPTLDPSRVVGELLTPSDTTKEA